MLIDIQAEAPQAPSVQIIKDGQVVMQTGPSGTVIGAPSTRDMYLAAKAYREVLQEQLERVRETRRSVASAMRDDGRTGPDMEGLTKRLAVLDERTLDLEKQLQAADLKESQAASQPGAVIDDPPPPLRTSPDPDAVLAGGLALSFALLFPFAVAFSRRIWRRSAKTVVTLPPEVNTRMQAMEDAIEAVAVEVERIGEGQRFMTQALSESPRGLGAGAAEPIHVRAREGALVERPI